LSAREYHDAICQKIGRTVDFDATCKAASEIFELNLPVVPLVSQLHAAGYRTGVLSNTCTTHWDYCRARYRILSDAFDVHALSFQLGEVKPNREIYLAAAELAGVSPHEIFFCDDLPENVEGARTAGFDAVLFTTAAALSDALRQRGVRFNH